MTMIEMRVGAIAVDAQTGAPIVLLSDPENKRALPIWIGLPEARAITLAANNVHSRRPLTHELVLSVIKQFGYVVKEIEIEDIRDDTYIAAIVLAPKNDKDGKSVMKIDARPSDAIALATIVGAPVLVASEIVAQASVDISAAENLANGQQVGNQQEGEKIRGSRSRLTGKNRRQDPELEERERQEFKEFLAGINASDFKLNQPIELPDDDDPGETGKDKPADFS